MLSASDDMSEQGTLRGDISWQLRLAEAVTDNRYTTTDFATDFATHVCSPAALKRTNEGGVFDMTASGCHVQYKA